MIRTVVTDIDGYRHVIVGLDPNDKRLAITKCGIRVAYFFGKGNKNPIKCPSE